MATFTQFGHKKTQFSTEPSQRELFAVVSHQNCTDELTRIGLDVVLGDGLHIGGTEKHDRYRKMPNPLFTARDLTLKHISKYQEAQLPRGYELARDSSQVSSAHCFHRSFVKLH
ncbi:hypothetical protein Ae201684P_015453 [Aphanomyces euteiches]|uniref:Uncharacterized protein n=1 Tax=Aphanomyces euteiches TaxID=100861 RepID=A0A6G0WQV6_9STRA|nr:hypothetical protein Ae201684_012668 [Aphanomyces euteiches]KAH9095653.1 hypothetical protein Ae201684P_015453 [Aphanomyces euteiches]